LDPKIPSSYLPEPPFKRVLCERLLLRFKGRKGRGVSEVGVKMGETVL